MTLRERSPGRLATRILDGAREIRWRLRGGSPPPPSALKRSLVRRLGRRLGLAILIETGTATGDMVAAQLGRFRRIVSIELDPRLAVAARERFTGEPSVEILEGDSAQVLPRVLAELVEPALFWLDAHAMAGGVRGPEVTPVRDELAAILAHPVAGHLVLADDARLFREDSAYPTLAEVEATVRRARPGARFEVRDDVIRVRL